MSAREITKELAGQEDVLFGQGTVNQIRNGTTYPITKIDKVHPVATRAALKLLPVSNVNLYFSTVLLMGLSSIGSGGGVFCHSPVLPKSYADDFDIIADSAIGNGCWIRVVPDSVSGPYLQGTEVGAWLAENTNNLARGALSSGWSLAGMVIATNTVQSPDGSINGATLTDDSGITEEFIDKAYTVPIDSLTRTFSVALKAGTITAPVIWVSYFNGVGYSATYIVCNLTAGTITSHTGTGTSSVTPLGDGWHLYTVNAPHNNTAGYTTFITRIQAENWGAGGASTGYFYAWGDVCSIASKDLSATKIDLKNVGGVLTKSPVATGAELQAYSGFTTSNYLERVYGADLDITDQVTLMAWIKTSTAAFAGIAGNFDNAGGDEGGYMFHITGSPLRMHFYASNTNVVDTTALPVNEWTMFVGTMTTAGLLSLYRNGQLVSTQTGGVLNPTVTPFSVGVFHQNDLPVSAFNGSVALERVFHGVLSAEQIKDIYRKEKAQFLPSQA